MAPALGQAFGQQPAAAPAGAPANGLGLDAAALTPQGNAAAITLGNPAGAPQGALGGAAAPEAGGIVEAILQIVFGFLRLFGLNVGMPGNPGFGDPGGAPIGNPGFGDPGGAPIGSPGFGDPGGAPIGDPGFGDPGGAPVGNPWEGQAAGAAQPAANAADYEKGLFEQANAVRRGLGLRELRWSDDLSQAARRSAAAGTHLAAPEILSFGDGSPADAINMWRGSPPHWGILTDPGMTEMGAGRAGGNSAITFR
ncbi:MAG: hypothetical protein FJZ01_06085 [Candidatus Sericytochromatia bacterium]|nr:hypothetical protein [Candidatus Tanganyikabacteria bacterium]